MKKTKLILGFTNGKELVIENPKNNATFNSLKKAIGKEGIIVLNTKNLKIIANTLTIDYAVFE